MLAVPVTTAVRLQWEVAVAQVPLVVTVQTIQLVELVELVLRPQLQVHPSQEAVAAVVVLLMAAAHLVVLVALVVEALVGMQTLMEQTLQLILVVAVAVLALNQALLIRVVMVVPAWLSSSTLRPSQSATQLADSHTQLPHLVAIALPRSLPEPVVSNLRKENIWLTTLFLMKTTSSQK